MTSHSELLDLQGLFRGFHCLELNSFRVHTGSLTAGASPDGIGVCYTTNSVCCRSACKHLLDMLAHETIEFILSFSCDLHHLVYNL
jgi:hypothetical protein